jgi:chemotaxis protein MotB
MTTFSDLITLMLTFFVLLISMSSMDDRVLRQTFGFFDDAMGVLDKVSTNKVHHAATLPINAIISVQVFAALEGVQHASEGQSERMAMLVERIIDEHNLEDMLEARAVPGGVVITVAARLLFESDGTTLRADAEPILAALADLLNNPRLHLQAVGLQEVQRGPVDPWKLATDRALAVIGHLLNKKRVDSRQLSIAAYGPGWEQAALGKETEKLDLVLTWQDLPLRSESE